MDALTGMLLFAKVFDGLTTVREVGVNGLEGFCFLAFSSFLLVFLTFPSLLFVFLALFITPEQTAVMYQSCWEFHPDSVSTDTLQKFPQHVFCSSLFFDSAQASLVSCFLGLLSFGTALQLQSQQA